MTVADAICQRRNTEASNAESTENDIRAGDLGAILMRVRGKICLAVAEILNFKKGTSVEIGEITIDELEESDKLSLSMVIQLVQLKPLLSHKVPRSSQADFTWISTGEYIQIMKTGHDGAISRKHVVIRCSQLCKTQLVTKGKSFSTSNCKYHYATMIYSKVAKQSKSTPCSNVPLHCLLCPLGL